MGFIIAQKLGWNENGTAFLKNTLITSVGVAGLGLGSVFGSYFINLTEGPNRKISMTQLLLICNINAIMSNSIKLVLIYPIILIGRFMFGLSCGILNMILSKAINETVPAKYVQSYGMAVNTGMCFGILLTNVLAAILIPLPEQGSDAL